MPAEARDPRLVPRLAPRLATARAKYERMLHHGKTVIALSFDEMLDSLLMDCLRYSDIAAACGVSRERIQQIHRDIFSGVIKRKGWRRAAACRIRERNELVRTIGPAGLAADFAAAARMHGLNVQAIVWSELAHSARDVYAHKREILCNGRLVRISEIASPRTSGPRSLTRYYRFKIPTGGHEFVAVRLGSPLLCWFIVPVVELRSRYTGTAAYIPEKTCDYIPSLGVTDWVWRYREAWDLF